MKKVLLIIVALFVLSGCSANYNLEIYNEDIKKT
jgi:uncharacterized protein YcfL